MSGPVVRGFALMDDRNDKPGNAGLGFHRLISTPGVGIYQVPGNSGEGSSPFQLRIRPALCVRRLERYEIGHGAAPKKKPPQGRLVACSLWGCGRLDKEKSAPCPKVHLA